MIRKIVKMVLAGLILFWFAYMAFSGEVRVPYRLKIADGYYLKELQYDVHKIKYSPYKFKKGDWFAASYIRDYPDSSSFPIKQYGFTDEYIYGQTNEQYFISSKSNRLEDWWDSELYSSKEEWLAELNNIGISDYEPLLDPRQEVLKYPLREVTAYNFDVMAGFLGVSNIRWLAVFWMFVHVFYLILGLFVKEKSMKYWVLFTSWPTGIFLCYVFEGSFQGEFLGIIFYFVILFPLSSLLLYKIGNWLYLGKDLSLPDKLSP